MQRNIQSQISQILETHKKMVAKLQDSGLQSITSISEMIIKSLKNGGTVYICGNGGSAADAQHIAGELVNRFESDRKALAAVALTTDSSVMTSIGNDACYEKIFSRQAEALVKKGDVLWALSTSGTSESILAAVKVARKKGASIVAFTGRKKSKLEQIADVCLCADNESTARSQEIHQIAYHIICKLVEQDFRG